MASVIHYKFKNELKSHTITVDGPRVPYENLKQDVFLRHFGHDDETDIDLEDEHGGKGAHDEG